MSSGLSRHWFHAPAVRSRLALAALLVLCASPLSGTPGHAAPQPGDILVLTNDTVLQGGGGSVVWILDPVAQQSFLLSDSPLFEFPLDLVVDGRTANRLFVSQSAQTGSLPAVLTVNTNTGATNVFVSGGLLDVPWGIAQEPGGDLLVANGPGGLVRIDRDDQSQTLLSSGGLLQNSRAVAVRADGRIFVGDDGSLSIVEIDPVTGGQSLVSTGGLLGPPRGLDVDAGGALVVSQLMPDPLIAIDPDTGAQTLLPVNGFLNGPYGLSLDQAGDALVAVPASLEVVRVDATGQITSLLLADQTAPISVEVVFPDCSDGIDNDQDGAVDFPDDVDCASADGSSEAGIVGGPSCGLGFEVAPALALLARLRGRRSARAPGVRGG